MKEETKRYLQRSRSALEAAQSLYKQQFLPDAANRIYYSMFYAAKALLAAIDVDVSKHSAVESALGYYFVKPGRMDAKYHRMYIDAREVREIADYDIVEEIIEPNVSLTIDHGKEFLQEVERILRTQYYAE
ncbi:MAG: HEPN domain-containing protein [bacterium]|nr:HEPN domain-containing protein [bacterium]